MRLLAGRVVVVTGAARGIGRCEALLLAQEGASVVVNDLEPPDATAAEIAGAGGEAIVHAGDVSERETADALVAAALGAWGRLDGVVNNAGILRDRMVFNLEDDDWDDVVRVNLRGHFVLTRAACAHWRQLSKSGFETAGRIVNTTSTSGLLGQPGQANYGAAKAGIAALTQIAAMEAARFGATVNAVAPGARTRLTEAVYGPPAGDGAFDPLDPANVAPLVAFLLSDAAAHISGQVFRVHGGVIELYEGWHPVATLDRDRRWEPSELVGLVDTLFEGRETRYAATALHDPAARS